MRTIARALIRALTALIPFKGVRKRVRRRIAEGYERRRLLRLVPRIRERYAERLEHCRGVLARGGKVRVAFIVCDAAMFSFEPVYSAMLADPRFDPFIAVVPRVTRGEEFLRATLDKTMKTLSPRYGGRVRRMYDPDTRRETPLEGAADLVFTSVLYDDQTCARYTAEPMSRYALVAGSIYGYGGVFNSSIHRVATLPQVSMFWRFYVSNPALARLFGAASPLLAGNMRVGGYPKMDRLAKVPVHPGRPRTILVCPHHTLARGDGVLLGISNFLRYSDFFLRLPGMFPQARFVFRPHPLLFPRLATDRWWGKKRTDEYRAAMEAMPNVEFQQGGDYFETFANSDAMVHDCSSFLAEYFYTGRPQCFIVESDEALAPQLTPFGKTLLDHVSKAYGENEIVEFVRRAVAGGFDGGPDAETRAFAEREVCVAHPDATGLVLRDVVSALEGGAS